MQPPGSVFPKPERLREGGGGGGSRELKAHAISNCNLLLHLYVQFLSLWWQGMPQPFGHWLRVTSGGGAFESSSSCAASIFARTTAASSPSMVHNGFPTSTWQAFVCRTGRKFRAHRETGMSAAFTLRNRWFVSRGKWEDTIIVQVAAGWPGFC